MRPHIQKQEDRLVFQETDDNTVVLRAIKQQPYVRLLYSGLDMSPSIKTGDIVKVSGIGAAQARKGDILLVHFPQQQTLKLLRFINVEHDTFVFKTDHPNLFGMFYVLGENIVAKVVRNENAARNIWLSNLFSQFYYFACRRKPSSEVRTYGGPTVFFVVFYNAARSFWRFFLRKKKTKSNDRSLSGCGSDSQIFYRVADITFCLESARAFPAIKRTANVERFRTKFPTSDRVHLRYHFGLPPSEAQDDYFYEESLWRIARRQDGSYRLEMYSSHRKTDSAKKLVAYISKDYSTADIYIDKSNFFSADSYAPSLTLFTTDQILLAPLLSYRQGMIIHACGIVISGKGYIFAAQAGTGKTTIANMFLDKATILCDDRVVVRKQGGQFRLYGTWSHGDLPFVSPEAATLGAIFFLHQSTQNRIAACQAKDACVRIYARKIFSFIEKQVHEKAFDFCSELAAGVPCFDFYFKKDASVVEFLENALRSGHLNTAGVS